MCAARDCPSPPSGLSVVQSFEDAVSAALGEIAPGAVLLAAVSGGADSTAMLCALASLRKAKGFALRCVHVEHGIRPASESGGDAEAVVDLCGDFGLPCKVVSVPRGRIAAAAKEKGIGLEAAARFYRRRILRKEAPAGGALILTAHTRSDLLETVLMRVLRGSGPRGLAAMPVSRGPFLRPLLTLSRADVLAYLAARGIPFRVDSTNADDRFLRNRVRNKLVPVLNGLFPGWETPVEKFAGIQSLAADFIEDEARRRVVWEAGASEAAGQTPGAAAESASYLRPRYLQTPWDSFFAQPEIIREEAVFQGIGRMENLLRETASRPASDTREPAPRGTVKRSNIRLFCGGTLKALNLGSAHGSGPSALALKKENGFVILSRAGETEREYGFSLLIKEPGLYTLKGITFEVKASGRGSVPLPERSRGPVFFAVLPFVLRGAYPDDRLERAGRKYVPSDVGKKTGKKGSLLMSAADIQGIAAFIACTDRPVPVVCRDSPESGECVECTVF